MLGKIIRRIASWQTSNWLRCQFFRFGGVKIGKGTKIARGARIGQDVELGSYVQVFRCAFIGGNVKIGNDSVVGEFAHVGSEVILSNKVTVGAYSYISNAIIGNNSFIESFVRFTGFKKGSISVGKNTYIGMYAVLDWSGNIEIGDGVHIAGPSVGIWTHTSVYQCLLENALDDNSRKKVESVKIGSHTYIGGNSTIYPGVVIGSHSVVLPNTAVNTKIDNYTMVGGVPAKTIRKIEKAGDEISFKSPELNA